MIRSDKSAMSKARVINLFGRELTDDDLIQNSIERSGTASAPKSKMISMMFSMGKGVLLSGRRLTATREMVAKDEKRFLGLQKKFERSEEMFRFICNNLTYSAEVSTESVLQSLL